MTKNEKLIALGAIGVDKVIDASVAKLGLTARPTSMQFADIQVTALYLMGVGAMRFDAHGLWKNQSQFAQWLEKKNNWVKPAKESAREAVVLVTVDEIIPD